MLGVARGCAGQIPKEIEGKRLGITLAGKNTALVFMRMNDVDTSKVTLVPIQYDPAPLAAGEIDALWGFAPLQHSRSRLLRAAFPHTSCRWPISASTAWGTVARA